MQRIVITLDGGLISGITADEDIEVVVIDRDTEGADVEELTVPISGDPAHIQQFVRTGTPELVDSTYANYHLREDG